MTLLTVEEARRMVCPVMSTSGVESCHASDCMAWRWGRGDYEFAMTKDDTSDPGAIRFVSPEGDGWERVMSGMLAENVVGWARKQFPDLVPGLTAWRRLIRGNGYCGLAGEVSP